MADYSADLCRVRSSCDQMADAKALAPRAQRDVAISGVLQPAGVLPDLIHLIRSYDFHPLHRWTVLSRATSAAAATTVSENGLSLTMKDGPTGPSPVRVLAASDRTFREGPVRWRVRVPAHVTCWVGVMNMATGGRLNIGNFRAKTLAPYTVGGAAGRVARSAAAHLSHSIDSEAIVRFEFDPVARTLSIGMMAGRRVEDMRIVFEDLSEAAALAPCAMLEQSTTALATLTFVGDDEE